MLEIGIALSNNSERYLEFLIETIKLTAAERYRFVLGVNHGADIDSVQNIVKIAGVSADVFDAKIDSGYGSLNHGLCLDLIFKRMHTEFGMLVDCDVAFLAHNWDYAMRSKLVGDVVIVGAEYDGDKYKKFPNVIGAMFKTEIIRSLGISFIPEGQRTLAKNELSIYGYEGNDPISIILDTGSELPRKIKAAGFSGLPMPIFRADHPLAKFMSTDVRGEEYQLDGIPLFTHLGRSYTRKFGVNQEAIAWETLVRKYHNA